MWTTQGLNKNSGSASLHRIHQLSGQWHQVQTGGRPRQEFGFLGLCSAHWRGQKPSRRGIQETHTHSDQYLLFDFHHPLQHKLGVIRTLKHRAENVSTSTEAKENKQQHLKEVLKACCYPNWAFGRTTTRICKNSRTTGGEEKKNISNNIVILTNSGGSSTNTAFLCFSSTATHPKDNTPKWAHRSIHEGDKTDAK